MNYSIKNVAEKVNISPHTLRYYEKEGLLTEIHRSKGGIRYYTDEDIEVLDLICCLKKTGLPLKEIKTFVQLSREGDATLKERCAILKTQQQSVMEQIAEMQQYLEKVTWKLNYFTSLLQDKEKHDIITTKEE